MPSETDEQEGGKKKLPDVNATLDQLPAFGLSAMPPEMRLAVSAGYLGTTPGRVCSASVHDQGMLAGSDRRPVRAREV